MLKALIDFLLNRKGHPVQHDTPTLAEAPVAPYKVEPPATGGTWPFPTAGAPEEKPVKPAVKAKSVRTKKSAAPAAMTPAEKPKKVAKPRVKKAKE